MQRQTSWLIGKLLFLSNLVWILELKKKKGVLGLRFCVFSQLGFVIKTCSLMFQMEDEEEEGFMFY